MKNSFEFLNVLLSITSTSLPTVLLDWGVLPAVITIIGISFEKTELENNIMNNKTNPLNIVLTTSFKPHTFSTKINNLCRC